MRQRLLDVIANFENYTQIFSSFLTELARLSVSYKNSKMNEFLIEFKMLIQSKKLVNNTYKHVKTRYNRFF